MTESTSSSAAAEPAPFSLTNLSGGPVHNYELISGDQNTKSAIYQRRDGQRLKWDDQFGWSARDEKTNELLTINWGVPASEQGDRPGEGVWVGKKGTTSFVYHGKFGMNAADKKAQASRYREAVGGVEM